MLRKALKISLWIIGSIMFLILVAILLLMTPPGKEFVRKQAESFLRDKLKTTVEIGEINYSIPQFIALKNVVFLDQSQDTLLAGDKIKVDINMLKLINSHIAIEEIHLENISAHIYRNAPDTHFNFSYIIDAFTTTPSGETVSKDSSGGSTLQMSVDRLKLNNIRFRFDDYTGGNRFGLMLDELNVTMDKIDPANLIFHFDKIFISGVKSSFIIDTSYLPPVPDTTSRIALQLAANELHLENIHYKQESVLDNFFMDIKLSKLIGHPHTIDLYNQTIAVKDLTLSPSNIVISMDNKAADETVEVIDTLVKSNPLPTMKWRVLAGDVKIHQLNFKYDNLTMPRLQNGIDYAHINTSNLNLHAQTIYYTTDTIAAALKHLSLQEQSGLDLQEFKTDFVYHPQGGYLKNLYLQTDNTILQNYARVKYPSLESLNRNMNLMLLEVNLQQSIIGVKDLLIFAPELAKEDFLRKHKNGMLRLDARLNGRLDNLKLNQFNLSGLGNTELAVTGNIAGLPEINHLSYDLRIAKLQSSKYDIAPFLPAAINAQIDLPDRFTAMGTLSGTVNAYSPDLYIRSTDGNIKLKGLLSMADGAGKERYDVHINTHGLALGNILKNNQIGSISASIQARGTSFDIKKMKAYAQGKIHAAQYNGYAYRQINFKGNIANQLADFQLISKDTNLRMDMIAQANFKDTYPAVKAILDIDSINLKALHIHTKQIKIRGVVDADITALNPDYPSAKIVVREPSVAVNAENYYLDSIYIVSKPVADSGNQIYINAAALVANIWGHTPVSKMASLIQYQINKHYAFDDSIFKAQSPGVVYNDTLHQYNLNLKASINQHPVLYALVPDLKKIDSVDIEGFIDRNNLQLQVAAPKIQYATYNINDARIDINGDNHDLKYQVSVDRFTQNDMDLWYPHISGNIFTNTVTATIAIADADSNQKYKLSALLQRDGEKQTLSLQKGLLLNYEEWAVNDQNSIVFAAPGFYVQNFGIQKATESISIQSETPEYNAPLTAKFNNFLLENITAAISKDTTLLNGSLSGTVNIKQIQPAPMLSSALLIHHLSFLGDTLGDMNINVKSETENALQTEIELTGYGNNVTIDGKYYMEAVNGDNFDLRLLLNPLHLNTLEGLTNYAIKNSSGKFTGDININGTTAFPELKGVLKTHQISTNVAMLNQRFTLEKEEILFRRGGIRLDNFDILDSNKNKLTIDGRVITRDYRNMNLAMKVKARKWQAMNATAKDNEDFYGKLFLTTKMDVFGPLAAPNIDGNIHILKNTDVTVAIPEQQIGMQDHIGIVKFVNIADTGKYKLTTFFEDTTEKLATVPKGSEINLSVDLDEEAQFSIIIDQSTGDFIKISGAANLNTTVAPDGTLGLVGTYEIKNGEYQLNYNLIKRLFRIQPGSTLTFSGDPTQAQANITAVYEALVPPYDLVSRQVDEQELVYYKQRLPFEVHMKLNGELMKPEISFDIRLPAEKTHAVGSTVGDLVQARLTELRNNPSDLNKQVFALILLNRFVAENPFESGAGRDAESIARQSASRFITEQLNKFAGNLVQGLDLTMDLVSSEDYTTGQRRNRTDLNISASKKLLNDRLTLTVGNNFQLEGPQSNATQGTSFIPGNLAADYDLTKDRRYRVRFYRRNEDMGIIDGFVVKTGASFILTVDYNKFRQVWMSRKKRRELRREQRERREQQQRENEKEHHDEKRAQAKTIRKDY